MDQVDFGLFQVSITGELGVVYTYERVIDHFEAYSDGEVDAGDWESILVEGETLHEADKDVSPPPQGGAMTFTLWAGAGYHWGVVEQLALVRQ